MLALTLTPGDDRPVRPGDVTTVVLKATNPTPTPLDLAGLGVELACTETVDTGWVDRRYVREWSDVADGRPALPGCSSGGAGAAAAAWAASGRRRAARTLFSPPPALVASSATLPPHSSRTWTVRARLPPTAPPTFMGTAASYRWAWRAGARFAPGGGGGGGGGGGSADGATDATPPPPPPPPPTRQYGWQEAGAGPAPVVVLPLPPATPGVAPPPLGCVAAGPGADPAPPVGGFDGAAAGRAPDAALVVTEGAVGDSGGGGGGGTAIPGQWRPAAGPTSSDGGGGGGGGGREVVDKGGGAPLFMSLSPARRGSEGGGGGGGAGGAAPPAPPTPGESSDGGATTAAPTTAAPAAALPSTPAAAAAAFALRVAGVDAPPVRLSLHANPEAAAAPGGVVRGSLDFSALHGARSGRHPRCVFYAVALECVEVVARRGGVSEEEGGSAPAAAAPAALTVADEAAEATAHLLTSHFSLCIPVGAPPSLATPLVSIRWRLRFEFCCEAAVDGAGAAAAGGALPPPRARGWFGGGGGASGATARPPPPPPIEWTLPVLILPSVSEGGEAGV